MLLKLLPLSPLLAVESVTAAEEEVEGLEGSPVSKFSRSAGLLFPLFRMDFLALALAETPPLDGGLSMSAARGAMSSVSTAVSRPDRPPPE